MGSVDLKNTEIYCSEINNYSLLSKIKYSDATYIDDHHPYL